MNESINWVLCSERLPSRSGSYLVSRYGFEFDDDLENYRVIPNKEFRYVEIGFFLIDVLLWDNNKYKNIYAWAELPNPCGC